MLANANSGGENVHRGIVLGALLGAAAGEAAIPEHLKDGLKESGTVREEIETFKEACCHRRTGLMSKVMSWGLPSKAQSA